MEEIIKENQEESAKKINEEISAALAGNAPESESAQSGSNTRPDNVSSVTVGDILTQEEFEDKFFELFDLAGELTGIKEVKIDREKKFEVAGAKATSKRLYTCAQKYKMLHFLIENGGGWFADAILIGGFCYAKANIIVYHYSGRGIGSRIAAKFKRLPAGVQEKAGLFSRFFAKKEVNNESEVKA